MTFLKRNGVVRYSWYAKQRPNYIWQSACMHLITNEHKWVWLAFWFKNECTFWGGFSNSKSPRKNAFPIEVSNICFSLFRRMSASPVVCLHLEDVAASNIHEWRPISESRGLSRRPLQLVPSLNKPHDIYNRVNMLKELSKCSFLMLICCSESVVATACSIVGCQVTEQLNRLSILLGFNGVDRGAPTCGESGI